MQNNKQSQISATILVVGVILAGVFLLKNTTPSNNKQANKEPIFNTSTAENRYVRPVDNNDHIMGNKSAEIVIVEYSDTECPFCKVFHKTMHTIVDKSNNRVAWVYRHYPIPQLHKKAFHEAEATECAYELGGNETFWKYIDAIFTRTQSNDKLPVEELNKIASDIGLNSVAFNVCLDSGKFKQKIEQSISDGEQAGVKGTPSSFILKNGQVVDVIEGAGSLESVMEKINKAITN